MRQASRREQLQRLLGEIGQIAAYVSCADGSHPAPGWYATLTNGHKPPKTVWQPSDGLLYLGHDSTQAAVTIAGLRRA